MTDENSDRPPPVGRERNARGIRVIQGVKAAVAAVELIARANGNETLAWIARASCVLLSGAAAYIARKRRP